MNLLEPERLSSIIADIYDCSLDVRRWDTTLERIAQHMNAAYVAAFLGKRFTDETLMLACSPWDRAELVRLLRDHRLDPPGAREAVAGDIDSPRVSLMVMPETEFHQTPFYRNWAAPQGLRDGCVMKFVDTSNRFGLVTAVTFADREVISAEEARFFQVLSPHLRRAALIGDTLEQALIIAETHRRTLDGLATPVFLCDGGAVVSFANTAARDLVRKDDRIGLVLSRLTVRPIRAAPLAGAVLGAATAKGQDLGGRGVGLALSEPGEPPLVAYVLPLGATPGRFLGDAATVAVFISQSGDHMPAPSALLATLFDLTPTESRVMIEIARGQGEGVSETADALGVSQNTIKTHLNRIYAKTQTSKQSELVALMAQIAHP
jgi:DNA-binding CsgD family transcriptional regulator/PAS domain-containing protein